MEYIKLGFGWDAENQTKILDISLLTEKLFTKTLIANASTVDHQKKLTILNFQHFANLLRI